MYMIKLLLTAFVALTGTSFTPGKSEGVVQLQNIPMPKTLALHGWLPFWAKASGTKEMLDHVEYFTSISPFSLEVNEDGTLFNRFAGDATTSLLLTESKSRAYKVVPTIAWFSAEQIDTILASSTTRAAHVANIVQTVNTNRYDGIDIDYEGKYLRTKDSYSSFIKELSVALHRNNKILQCTVEARTPAEDRYFNVPKEVAHASDYKVLNTYCDSVRIMAYDQRDDDKTLVYENGAVFYRPVADHTWVEKTIHEALYDINRRKLVVGIPTYGNVYKATVSGSKTYYSYVSAINYDNAMKRAEEYKTTPLRNIAGELQFSYKKDNAIYYVTFTDAVAIKKKLLLAEKYGLNGVALFKIDGGMDQKIWAELKRKIKIAQKTAP